MTHNTMVELVAKAKLDLADTLKPYYDRLLDIQKLKNIRLIVFDSGEVRYDYGEETAEEKYIKEIIQKHVDATKKYVDELIKEIG